VTPRRGAERDAQLSATARGVAFVCRCALLYPVQPERLSRYADKLDHARQRLEAFEAWDPTPEGPLKDRLAGYKALQEASEALLDTASMLAKDLGTPPKDNHANISMLEEHDILSEAPARALHEVAGLRNRLVHEYNGLDDEIAIDSARRLAPDLRKACEEVRSWLSTNG
jgi:uncharacterized protein YutE (UPF0331/DUF86 family)